MAKRGMLLVGHGSKLPHNKELIETTADLIGRRSADYIVKPGFMSMNKPDIDEQLEAFRNEDIDMLVVVPLFLAKGVHINQDIPEKIGLPAGARKGTFRLNGRTIPLIYADPIGSDPLLAELMLKNAEEAVRELSS